jgi:hypothetical protein
MANGSAELRSLLKDVEVNGVVVIAKKKLLWLLGWGQDREGAWKDLLNQWVEINPDRDALHGIEMWDKIVLTMRPASKMKWEPVEVWAGEQK